MHNTEAQGSGKSTRPEPEFLEVARVLRPLGVHGELKVEAWPPHTDDLAQAATLYLGDARRPMAVEHVRAHGEALALKLAGCDDRNEAELLRNQLIYLHRDDVTPLGPDQYYYHQIVGLQVMDINGEELGEVVEIIETGANDVYVVHGAYGEVLLPAHAGVIKQIDLEAGRMVVEVLEGLLPE
jgi:16S rRNA processing protein RimM